MPATKIQNQAARLSGSVVRRIGAAFSVSSVALAIVFLAIYFGLDQLRFPIRGDEEHFWPTALLFSHSVRQSLHSLRIYEELSTPLPFFLWGVLEQQLHRGIWLGRVLNLIAAFTTSLIVLMSGRTSSKREILALMGMLICPYFLFVSVQLYTDPLAILFVVAGVALHLRGRYWFACLLFVLAIATRQYMVAFPIALLVHDVLVARSPLRRPHAAVAAPIISAASLGGWYLIFGGFGPQAAVELQDIRTVKASVLIPENAFYFLACVGLYYTAVRWVLLREMPGKGLSRRTIAVTIALVAAGFMIFPPLRNHNFPVITMGLLDRTLRGAHASDAARVAVFMIFGIAAMLSVLGRPLQMILLFINALVLTKAHIAWDKYSLPLLAVFWFLEARRETTLLRAGRMQEINPG